MLTKPKTIRITIAVFFVLCILAFSASFYRNTLFDRPRPIYKAEVELHVSEPELNLTKVKQLSQQYDFAVTPPPKPWSEKDLEFFQSIAGETVFSQLAIIPEAHETPDFTKITAAERLFKSLFNHFDKILSNDPSLHPANSSQHKASWELYTRLERSLYPWLYPYWENAFHINNQTSGQGIVMCVGNNQFKFAASSVRALRQVLHSQLPIEIFYIRENDLSPAKRTYFTTQFKNVSLVKLDDYVGEYYTRFGGWAMKPFALLASRFSEVIMMDADAFFFQDPALLFQDKGYALAGSLFFYDRTLFANWEKGPDWLRSFLSTMTSFVPNTRWFKGTSSHEQESGVIVMNKKKSLLGLLATCKLNGITERDEVVYKHIHGDKETFWIGHEMMQTPYAFIKSFGAVIGNMGRGGEDGDPTQVCGNQLHLDTEQVPLWLNGGLYRDKHKQPLEYLNFTHFAQGNDWDFQTSCIRETNRISALSKTLHQVAMDSIQIDIQRAKDEEMIDAGTWKPFSLPSDKAPL